MTTLVPKARLYVGIDPGLGGALATVYIDAAGGQTVSVTPTVNWVPVGRGKRRRYALDRVNELVRSLAREITFAYLEAQSARPGQGAASTFTTGFGDGMWRALLTAHLIPFGVITPQRWRQCAGIPTAAPGATKHLIKSAVRQAAARRFPAVPIKLDHADAVMIAVAAALLHDHDRRDGESYA